jgi:hypothetical protein
MHEVTEILEHLSPPDDLPLVLGPLLPHLLRNLLLPAQDELRVQVCNRWTGISPGSLLFNADSSNVNTFAKGYTQLRIFTYFSTYVTGSKFAKFKLRSTAETNACSCPQ